MSETTPKIRWIRDKAGHLCFYKHNRDIYSEALADDEDEIIVLKAIVQGSRRAIVAIPVERELINEPSAGDWSLGSLNDEALFASKMLDEFQAENSEIHNVTLHHANPSRKPIDAAPDEQRSE